jgi:branched-subunit amino acid ABC-type transport system permease component
MNSYLPYVIIGLATGSVYGLSAMGLVLTYKTSGVFNFAHGAFGAGAAYTFLELRQRQHLPWPLAGVIAILVFGVITGLAMERIADGLAKVTSSYRIVATVGLLVGIIATIQLCFGTQVLGFKTFLSRSTAFTVSGVRVTVDSLIILLVGGAAAVALAQLFRRTRLGTAMRAVVDDAQLLDMTGEAPARVRRSAWIIGTSFAALSGVLFAEIQQGADALLLSLLVVQAFGAAAIGAFKSLPLAYAGGIIVGLAQAMTSKEITGHLTLLGLDTNMPFIVLLITLIVLPRGRLVEVGRLVKSRAVPASTLSRRARVIGGITLLALAMVVPFVVGSKLPLYSNALSQVVLFASLGLLVRSSGQISLCQWGLAAVGGVAFAHLLQHGTPWGIAVLLAAFITVPVGALVSLPAIRISGLYLGLATLGFGVLLAGFFYSRSFMFGLGSTLDTHRPKTLGLDTDRGFYYLLLLIAIAALVFVTVIERSRLGRLLRGLADSPIALSTLGTNVNQTRMIVFSVSAFLAGLSGATYSSLFGSINRDSFNYVVSIEILAVLVVSGRRTVTSAIVAPLLFVVVPGYISNPKFTLYEQIAFGILALAAALASNTSASEIVRRFSHERSSASRFPHGMSTTRDRVAALHGVRPASRTGNSALATSLGAGRTSS